MIELLLKAENALSLGLLDQAERVYWQAIEHDPKNAIAVVGLSRVALERGDEWTALDFAARALAIDPDNATARRLIVRLTEVIQRRGDGPHGMPAAPSVHPVSGDPDMDAALASVMPGAGGAAAPQTSATPSAATPGGEPAPPEAAVDSANEAATPSAAWAPEAMAGGAPEAMAGGAPVRPMAVGAPVQPELPPVQPESAPGRSDPPSSVPAPRPALEAPARRGLIARLFREVLMRVLVSGGAGYVGSVSVEALIAAGHEVVVLDDLSKGHRGAVHPAARLVAGSYGDPAVVAPILADGVDAVLHCAARSLVGESIAEPALYYRENVAGGVAFVEAIREAGVRRVVFSSTAAVYGVPAGVPIREDAALAPINPYGETKRTFEGILRWYAAAYGIRSICLRYFNVAGASPANGEVHEPETHLIPNILRAIEGAGDLTLFGSDYPTPDGTCIRDYLHVEDLARAHLLALEATDPDDARTVTPAGDAAALAINLGNGGGFSNREVIAAAERATGRTVPVHAGDRRQGDPPVLVADATRAREVLGWVPGHRDIVEIVESAWRWRVGHPTGY